ncbi:MAG: hypothetical protein ABJC39_06970 [Chloroflexota bacterium]
MDDFAELDEVLNRAAQLRPSERERFATWAKDEAVWSERNLAMGAAHDAVRRGTRGSALLAGMDVAYPAVARGAGHDGPVRYFDEDHGAPPA